MWELQERPVVLHKMFQPKTPTPEVKKESQEEMETHEKPKEPNEVQVEAMEEQ